MFQADLPQILQGYGILIECRAREEGDRSRWGPQPPRKHQPLVRTTQVPVLPCFMWSKDNARPDTMAWGPTPLPGGPLCPL